ncbi:unnamed protein product [Pseudo-nitzschia multistriata]|uniref:Uncharacterized protein n=1 Tax=Pseudo-nitzschia multistriata TaxID=183589 RepID=A0A448Z872_9STRA|nr:unnamed protein product [Pseudo-nitzschia multistriata]
MGGGKKRALGGSGPSSSSSMSVVEKLQILRGLSCGGFSESDLSNCLRQSGYRVDVAAERLVTGQFQPSKKANRNKGFFGRSSASTAPTSQTNDGTAPCPHKVATTPRQKPTLHLQSRPAMPQLPSAAIDLSIDDDPTSLKVMGASHSPMPPSMEGTSPSSSSSSILVTPKGTTPVAKKAKGLAPVPRGGKTTTTKPGHGDEEWLLCHRWVGDGVNLSRHGACDYQEEFRVLMEGSSSSSATTKTSSCPPKALRFRSKSHRMDGSFPRHLSFLGTLLKHNLIRLKATALMEEKQLPVGAQVAFGIRVWIVDPVRFFAVFRDGNNKNGGGSRSSYSKDFLYSGRNARMGQAATAAVSRSLLASCRECAFLLLQWAQHGKQETRNDDADGNGTGGTSSENESSNNDRGVDGSDDDDDDDDDGGDLDAATPTLHASAKDEEAAIPDWARGVLGAENGNDSTAVAKKVDDSHGDLETEHNEMDTPRGFREGIDLRPYQKQSLYWMTQREKKSPSGRKELVRLLQRLARESSTTHRVGIQHDDEVCLLGPRKGISCDCGPVVVDTNQVEAPCIARGFLHESDKDGNEESEDQELDHPLWERRFLCNNHQTKAFSFFVQPSFRNAAPEPPPSPLPCRGGILADSMGLGKTVQLLALVQSDKDENSEKEDADTADGEPRTNDSTLVVSPLSLLNQWEDEIKSKTTLTNRVHYNDGKKKQNGNGSKNHVDIVLTTYGTLQAELRTRRKAGVSTGLSLLSKNWKRVILDECHTIKNHSTMVAKACCLLRAERRWVVSGTIIQNSLNDVYSLIRFLRHEPFSEHAFWNTTVTKASDFSVALDRVKSILSPIMIRRTKETRDKTGKLILTLPDIDCECVPVQFSPEERQFYEALYRKSFDIFKGFIQAGTASSSWLKIFSLLQRLRQTCSHVALTVKSHLDDEDWTSNITQSSLGDGSDKDTSTERPIREKGQTTEDTIDQSFLADLHHKFKSMQRNRVKAKSNDQQVGDDSNCDSNDAYASSIANMLNQAVQSDSSELNEECPICLDNITMNDSAITPCLHIFCQGCLLGALENRKKCSGRPTDSHPTHCGSCPVCSTEIDTRRILRMNHSENGKIQTTFLHQNPQQEGKENLEVNEADGCARKILQTAIQGASSSKLAAILKELHLVWEKEPGSKVLIFSQFLGFLDIMEKSFKYSGISYGRLDGKLSLKDRMKVLSDFNSGSPRYASSHNSNAGTVLLISMKAGGVGLNLVAAKSVFIVDPWWNAAVEDQCVDRIHRIGQSAKTIYVRKFFVLNSIEERILELQKRKKEVARAALCDKAATEAEGISRPSIDDFKILFRA